MRELSNPEPAPETAINSRAVDSGQKVKEHPRPEYDFSLCRGSSHFLVTTVPNLWSCSCSGLVVTGND